MNPEELRAQLVITCMREAERQAWWLYSTPSKIRDYVAKESVIMADAIITEMKKNVQNENPQT